MQHFYRTWYIPEKKNVMKEQLFGREEECRLIRKYLSSNKSEFVAVYGRRRIGKTFLLRQTLGDSLCFSFAGMANVTNVQQLLNFNLTLRQYMPEAKMSTNWQEAFMELQRYVESCKQEIKVLFFDELPWMDTPKSNFISAFEHFWNAWASARSDIKLFVCGSAASWMLDNVINNHGGLHNRVTHEIYLKPFTIGQCKQYFDTCHFGYNNREISEFYMVFGGIPYYMTLMDKELSVVQNIDRLIFSSQGELRNEKDNLFRSLFRHSADYVAIIDAISKKGKGLTRTEILEETKLNNNALFGKRLEELEKCNFIRKYKDYSGRQRQTVFQLIDPLCHFWNAVVSKNETKDECFWTHTQLSPLFNTWCGFAFEMLCLNHVQQLKQILGISGIQTNVYSWRTTGQETPGAQIDLLIDRADRCVNLCEMKFSRGEYEITKTEREKIENRATRFMQYAEPRKSIRLTMITSFGLKPNTHSSIIQSQITLDDLFRA